MQFYVYILYSKSSNKFYVGYSNDPTTRLISHNNSNKVSYTSKHRPWELKAQMLIGDSESLARRVEYYIKKRKSRKFIRLCIDKQSDSAFINWMVQKCSTVG